MIRKMQHRFARIAVVSLTIAMVLVVGIVNIANWISVRKELSDTLYLLSESEVMPLFPEASRTEEKQAEAETEQKADGEETAAARKERQDRLSRRFTNISRHMRNMAAESSWFSGILEDGEPSRILMDRMENLSEEAAAELIRKALAQEKTDGRVQDYLYRIHEMKNGSREIVMLDCGTRLDAVRTLVLISAIACAGGILLALLLVILASRKAVEPTIRNMEQQKQFITNASHELKTPLTVIGTNMDLLQMENGDENPWIRSTQKQTAVLCRLVDELVYLSRMEEEHPTLEMEPFDPGKLLEETAEPFASMAEYGGKEMRVTVEEGLQMTGDRASIQRLISTLCDNAVKYAAAGPILARIRGEGRNVILEVSNPVSEPLTKQQCEQLFDRFYRLDPSRNKEKGGGFGIGLAIAAAVAEKHGGSISAAMEENVLVFTCVLPKECKK